MKPLDDDELAALDARVAREPVDLTRELAVALALTRIRRRAPTAVIRFGEGEGRVLAADLQDPASIRVAANKLKRQTGRRYGLDDVLRIRSMLTRAFDRADIVGLRGSSSFSEEHRMWVARIEAAFAERIAAGRPPAFVTHCLLNNPLRDNLATLLAGQDRISVISCREIAPVLSDQYGIADVATYQVPSQFIMRGVDDEYEAQLHAVAFWPDFYFELRRRLVVREPGEIFLVGAGILGKELCIRIRELGGIALDMGSCLDGLAGKVTRGGGRPEPYRAGESSEPGRQRRRRS